MKIQNHNYLSTCTLCGKPVHERDNVVSSKPKKSRYWVHAHAECLKSQQKDSEVRLK